MKHSYRCSWCEHEFHIHDNLEQEHQSECPACGMDAFLQKPVTYSLEASTETETIQVKSASTAV